MINLDSMIQIKWNVSVTVTAENNLNTMIHH